MVDRNRPGRIEFVVRPFEASGATYQALADLRNAVWPGDEHSAAELRHWDCSRDPQYLLHREVAMVQGKVVGEVFYGETNWSYRPGKFFIRGGVHPDWRRRGIGAALYDHAWSQLLPHDPVLIVTLSREDQEEALGFLSRRQFSVVQRNPTSRLLVGDFDWTKFDPIPRQVSSQGIQIRSLAELMESDPDWQQHYYDLDWEILQDLPTMDRLTRPALDVFVKRFFDSPAFDPAATFIALDGERWVGMSVLWLALGDPHLLETGLTGVLRSHRRRKIATALKVCAVRFARDHNYREIETDNEENNAMYQINLQLGFRPRPAWLELQKRLVDPLPWERGVGEG